MHTEAREVERIPGVQDGPGAQEDLWRSREVQARSRGLGGAAGIQISAWPIGQGAPTTHLFVLRYVNCVSFDAASYNDVNIYTPTHTHTP